MAQQQTATKTKTENAQPAVSQGEVAIFQPPRLPYHEAIKERFGIDRGGWKVLVEATFPSARTVDAIAMALAYCKQRNLDVFKKPIHIVPMRVKKGSRWDWVETVWPGISELRTTAFRTKEYAGMLAPEWGPDVEKTFKSEYSDRDSGEVNKVEKTVRFPEWCRITVRRLIDGHICDFVGPKVLWLESYATRGNTDVPNEMWADRPVGQLEKCSEAAALRRAFPEEIGNDYAAEEMEGKVLHDAAIAARDVTPVPAQRRDAGPPPPAPRAPSTDVPRAAPGAQMPPQPQGQRSEPFQATGPSGLKPKSESVDPERDVLDLAARDQREETWGEDDGKTIEHEPAKPAAAAAESGPVKLSPAEEKEWLNELGGAFSGCEELSDVAEKQAAIMTPMKPRASKEGWSAATSLLTRTLERIQGGTNMDAG